ncbi:hypothetical protein DC20_05800 [Rufibacter tibetensis]|uniref:Uncharacterized protein n=1 Tax=Rufibacter tibetensis TaxID=512763 RepID=A0A0P0C193_9BACT|nr:hypothetical protein DC20_05800 [Rufibacter tibetensis]
MEPPWIMGNLTLGLPDLGEPQLGLVAGMGLVGVAVAQGECPLGGGVAVLVGLHRDLHEDARQGGPSEQGRRLRIGARRHAAGLGHQEGLPRHLALDDLAPGGELQLEALPFRGGVGDLYHGSVRLRVDAGPTGGWVSWPGSGTCQANRGGGSGNALPGGGLLRYPRNGSMQHIFK